MARDDGRTVVQPRAAEGPAGDAFARLAAPMLALAAEAVRDPHVDAAVLAREAGQRAAAFGTEALRAGVNRGDAAGALDALVAVFEARVRANPALGVKAWSRARRRHFAGVPALDAAALSGRIAAAEAGGARELARFLRHCRVALEAAAPPPERVVRWGVIAPAVFLLAVAAWAGWAEWRYGRALVATLPVMAVEASAGPATVARELDALRATVAEVERRAPDSPLGLAPWLGRFGPVGAARRAYEEAAQALLPGPLGAALAGALATEGGVLDLYDTLRTLAILRGETGWQPEFVAGWIERRAAIDPAIGGLARHVAALGGAPEVFLQPDPELLAQARAIAAEGDPVGFAFLELARDPEIRGLPGWSPRDVADLATVLVRRSGRPLEQAVPGLYTAAGWRLASEGAAEAAIARAEVEVVRVTGRPARATVAPAALLDRLQRETLAVWTAEMADLRVQPFTDQPGSLLISGTLGRRDSPLEELFRMVWREAGGEDRGRSHENQLLVAGAFGGTIEFVEQGHMAEIAQLFAGLNVALATLDAESEVARRRLMDVRARAASVETLNLAPRLVVQVVEDVLAQTAASQDVLLRPPAMLAWQRDMAPACREAIAGHYPFGAGSDDADLATVATLLAPVGSLRAFIDGELATLLDQSESPWRWRPEARLAGFSADSAVFLERAAAIGEALFPASGPVGLTLTALAQRGAATVSLGGASVPVVTTGAPETLAWPGAAAEDGLAVSFATAQGVDFRAWPGPWGLMRFLDAFPLRARDDGQRYLIDVRLEHSRAYLQLAFPRQVNPATVRAWMDGLACPVNL